MLKKVTRDPVVLAAEDPRRIALLNDLLDQDLVQPLALSRARTVAQRMGQSVEQALNQMGVVSDDILAEAFARATGCELWDPDVRPPAPATLELPLSVDYLRQKRLLPIDLDEDRLIVAACDPIDDEALAGVAFACDRSLEILVAKPSDWRRAFADLFGEPSTAANLDERKVELDVQLISDASAESEGARLMAAVLETALRQSASDIHFEPRRHDLRIRLRLDGRLVDHQRVAIDLAAPIATRIKVLANLDLGERRLPQDGRATFVITGRPVDVRVSTLPSAFGEAVVLRLLDRSGVGFGFKDLGFDGELEALLRHVSETPYGIFLVTGPTGSGKTTTLYALLNSLIGLQKKILSIEDPIEYHFEHVVQAQAQPAIGLTFASALRSFLRQDPDVILVGEIRDAETAQVAIQAAMTGHLVLASLHANDAIKVVPRLLDMGIEPYQLAAALVGAVAQRLVRKLCPSCRKSREPNAAEQLFARRWAAAPPQQVFDAVGCPACNGMGYAGRLAVAEGFRCDEALAGAIARQEPMSSLTQLALETGYRPLQLDGCAKAGTGLTSLTEVMATALA